MKNRNPPRHLVFYAVLGGILIASALLTTATVAQNGVTNRGVLKRMNNMADAQTAIEILVDMMGGRLRFDRVQARAARRDLINAMGDIPAVFRKPHTDPLSRARPDIWLLKNDFTNRADSAERIARQLNTARLETLRSTLPDMIKTCLSCHRVYRKPR